MKSKRIGILGGTFNPLHTAHLIIAEHAREQLHLDKVLFIPSANPPHKDSSGIIDARVRLMLIEESIKDNEYFAASDIEIQNHSKSYTVDTLQRLKDIYGSDTSLFLLIGLDNLIDLKSWKEPHELFELAQVVVLNRSGYMLKDVADEFAERSTSLKVPNLEISSTDIRLRISGGKSIKYLVPASVEKYIAEHKLYL